MPDLSQDPLADPELARLALQKIVRGADHPWEVEQPPMFDPIDACERAMRLCQEINAIVGSDCPLELWPAVRSATFHGEIVLPSEVLAEPASAVIRMSNFADLATVLEDERVIQPAVWERIRQRIDRNGYRFVSATQLRGTYDGHHRGARQFARWIDRFFGYV